MAYFTILLIGALASSVCSEPEEDIRKLETEILDVCKEKTKASQDAVNQLLKSGDLDESPEGKCLIKCGLQTFGTMTEDGAFNNIRARDYMKGAYPENVDEAAEIWENCQAHAKKTDDKCDYAYKVIKCFFAGIKNQNIKKAW
uniref:Odorant-binding protein 6 n=1 Tax=Riptortus pedestris TaxID=329032 RepID=A0A2Z4HQ28_RIPPE|nr:odorant-binding protein 6 [Riptortus pedestris]